MNKLSDLINEDAATERTPGSTHYFQLVDAFIATLEELSAFELQKREKTALTGKLASDYYSIIACVEHSNYPRMQEVYEAVASSYGISLTRPLSKEAQRAKTAKYENEYLRDTELGLINAQNALRVPRLSKVQRQIHEDGVTFHGAELVCHERYFKTPALRRRCATLIEDHNIDRTTPLLYHRG